MPQSTQRSTGPDRKTPWWAEAGGSSKPYIGKRSSIPVPKIPLWIFFIFAATIIVAALGILHVVGTPRHRHATASSSPVTTTPLRRPDNPVRFAGRRTAPGGADFKGARVAPVKKGMSEAELGHVQTSVRTAFRLGETSGLFDVTYAELDLVDEWIKRRTLLGADYRLALKRLPSGRRSVRFDVSFDGGVSQLGVVRLKKRGTSWIIVEVREAES